MKKLIIATLMVISSSAVLADRYEAPSLNFGIAGASSSAVVGSGSSTANFGNGIASQSSKTWAANESGAGVRVGNGQVQTYAGSEGASGSSSIGFSYGAFGVTGGFAGQSGAAGAEGTSIVGGFRPR